MLLHCVFRITGLYRERAQITGSPTTPFALGVPWAKRPEIPDFVELSVCFSERWASREVNLKDRSVVLTEDGRSKGRG